MSVDPIGLIKERLDEGIRDTRGKTTTEQFSTWKEHQDNWSSMIRPLIGQLSEGELGTSMVIARLSGVGLNSLMWIYVCVLFGAYHSAIRELRYVLESMIQAYYLDSEHPEADMRCKLEIIKEIDRESFSHLIDRIEISYKQTMKVLYSELSQYVHSTYEELKAISKTGIPGINDRVMLRFDGGMFAKCVEMTNRVMDVVYLVTLLRFPQTKTMMMEDYDIAVKSFERHACNMTLEHIAGYKDR